jgi:FMN-dependent NADH-azoreductase
MLANEFLKEYGRLHPQDEIIPLDLYKEYVEPLTGEMLQELFAGKDSYIKKHAELFASADKYIIAAPMWNLSIPSILKAYFDYVVYVGISFKYTAEGPVPLLADRPRKALHVTTRGGAYSEGPAMQYEMGDKYIRTILGFMGIYDVNTLKLEMTNVLTGDALEAARQNSYQEAKVAAATF